MNIGKTRRLRFALLLLAFAGTAVLADSKMVPGAWEFKMKVTAPDASGGAKKNVTESSAKICLSPEFVDKEPFITATLDQEKMERKGATCSTSDYVRKGSNASWKMACVLADGNHVDMQVKSMASPHKMSMDFNQVVAHDGERATVKVMTSAAFIGECTSEMPVQ
jgi:hypothetical protein